MKRFFLIITSIVLVVTQSFGQEVQFEHKFDGIINNDLLVFTDDKDNVVVQHKSYIKDVVKKFKTHLIFNAKGGDTNEIVLPGELHIVGYSYDSLGFTFFYRNQYGVEHNMPTLEMMWISKDGKEMLGNGKMNFEDEEIISNFQYEGSFYFITADKKKEIIKLRISKTPNDIAEVVYDADKKLINNLSKNRFYFVHEKFEMSIDEIVYKNKAFFQNGKLYLATDSKINKDSKNQLNFVIFDIHINNLSISGFDTKLDSYNYFPFDNKLFCISISRGPLGFDPINADPFELNPANNRPLDLRIFDLASFNLIYSFSESSMENMELINSDVFKDGEVLEFKKNVSKRKFKALADGIPFLNVCKEADQIKLTFGSYSYPMGGSSTHAVGSGAVVISNSAPMQPFGVYTPMYYYYGNYLADASVKHYAYGYLNMNDFSINTDPHKNTNPYDMVADFVEKERDIKKSRIKKYSIYNSENYVYLLSYSSKLGMFTLRKW